MLKLISSFTCALILVHLSLIRFNTWPSHAKHRCDFRLHGNSLDLRKVIFYTGDSPESEWTDYTLEWLRQLKDNHAVLTVRVVRRTHAPHRDNKSTRLHTCATRRGYDERWCKLVSDKVRFYLGTLTLPEVQWGWERAAARGMNGGNGEQEKWATATLELSCVWQCSTTTTLVGLSAHYVDRRSHPRITADCTRPVSHQGSRPAILTSWGFAVMSTTNGTEQWVYARMCVTSVLFHGNSLIIEFYLYFQ